MDPAFQSFAAQALHYFRREHEAPAREPVEGPAAWRGAELAEAPGDLDARADRERDRRAGGCAPRRPRARARARRDPPRGLPAPHAGDGRKRLGARDPDRARLPAAARSARRALGGRGFRARLLGPRAAPRTAGRAEPGGRAARARGRHARGGGQPERASLPDAGRDPVPLRSRRCGGAALPAHGARGRRQPDRQQRLRLQRDPRAPAGPGGAPLRALPARLARRAAPRRAPVLSGAALPLRAGAAGDLLAQRLLPVGGATRGRGPLHGRRSASCSTSTRSWRARRSCGSTCTSSPATSS